MDNIFQFENRSNSLSIADGIREEINQKVRAFQEKIDVSATNPTELFKLLLDYAVNQDNNEVIPPAPIEENGKQDDIHIDFAQVTDSNQVENKEHISEDYKRKLIDEIGYEQEPTDEILFTDLLEIITTPIEVPKIEAEYKEVIKEVERELSENEILIDLKPKQHEILKKIARWRSHTKIDDATLPTGDIIKRMVFNHGTLLNEHGYFETGLNAKRAKLD